MSCRACAPDGLSYCASCTALAARAGVLLTPPRPALTLPAGISHDTMQDKLRGIARSLGYLYYHTHTSKRSDPGWPDTAIVSPNGGAEGSTLYLWELKTPKDTVSDAQRRWLDALSHVTRVVPAVCYPGDWAQMMDILARGAPPR